MLNRQVAQKKLRSETLRPTGIIAEASCETETEKLGHYKVQAYLKNEPKKIVALFKGMVYKTSKVW